MEIYFEKASQKHHDIIFNWLEEPHVKEFWDNTQAHKDDIINFISGRKTPSNYSNGQHVYWIASFDNRPFAMIMTIQENTNSDINQEKLERLSRTGNTYSLDYMIGNVDFLGKGYGARTLCEFVDFFRREEDKKADTFFIDPECSNTKANHVYLKAGFEHECEFIMKEGFCGAGKRHYLLIKKFK